MKEIGKTAFFAAYDHDDSESEESESESCHEINDSDTDDSEEEPDGNPLHFFLQHLLQLIYRQFFANPC